MFPLEQHHLNELEARLRQWAPNLGGLDRDRMLFEAGRAEALGGSRPGPKVWLWMPAAAAAVVLALGMGLAWRHERTQRRNLELALASVGSPSQSIIEYPLEAITKLPEKHTPDPSSYLVLVRKVKLLEDPVDQEPVQTAPDRNPPGPVSDPHSLPPLRPHDLDRVISL
jgi:hypothetical protein